MNFNIEKKISKAENNNTQIKQRQSLECRTKMSQTREFGVAIAIYLLAEKVSITAALFSG